MFEGDCFTGQPNEPDMDASATGVDAGDNGDRPAAAGSGAPSGYERAIR
jgi:hypothetical protein